MPPWSLPLLLVGSPVTHFFCILAAHSGHLHAVLGVIGHWIVYFGGGSRSACTRLPSSVTVLCGGNVMLLDRLLLQDI